MSTISQTETTLDLESLPQRLLLSKPNLSRTDNVPKCILIDEAEVTSESSSASTPATEYAQSAAGDVLPSEDTCLHQGHIENDRRTQTTQNALIVTPERAYQLVSNFPVPETLGAQEVMIRNYATGLNHIDWKSVDYNMCLPQLPWVLGREMAGVVEQIGSDVTTLKRGDRVWTSKLSLFLT